MFCKGTELFVYLFITFCACMFCLACQGYGLFLALSYLRDPSSVPSFSPFTCFVLGDLPRTMVCTKVSQMLGRDADPRPNKPLSASRLNFKCQSFNLCVCGGGGGGYFLTAAVLAHLYVSCVAAFLSLLREVSLQIGARP